MSHQVLYFLASVINDIYPKDNKIFDFNYIGKLEAYDPSLYIDFTIYYCKNIWENLQRMILLFSSYTLFVVQWDYVVGENKLII